MALSGHLTEEEPKFVGEVGTKVSYLLEGVQQEVLALGLLVDLLQDELKHMCLAWKYTGVNRSYLQVFREVAHSERSERVAGRGLDLLRVGVERADDDLLRPESSSLYGQIDPQILLNLCRRLGVHAGVGAADLSEREHGEELDGVRLAGADEALELDGELHRLAHVAGGERDGRDALRDGDVRLAVQRLPVVDGGREPVEECLKQKTVSSK